MKFARIFFIVWINLFSLTLVVLCVYSYTQNTANIIYPIIAVSVCVVLALLTSIVFSKKHGIWQPIQPKLLDSENTKTNTNNAQTKKILVKIVLVNNRTDKKYVVYANTEFGLTCTCSENLQNSSKMFIIQNLIDFNGTASIFVRATFFDFSVIETHFKTITIPYK